MHPFQIGQLGIARTGPTAVGFNVSVLHSVPRMGVPERGSETSNYTGIVIDADETWAGHREAESQIAAGNLVVAQRKEQQQHKKKKKKPRVQDSDPTAGSVAAVEEVAVVPVVPAAPATEHAEPVLHPHRRR